MQIQNEVARLPLVEEVPVTHNTMFATQHIPAHWRSPLLQASDLSKQDLSHRYLAHADLREAQLVHTNFFMADLSGDRKSTRLNSSHQIISYAVFCLKKKKKKIERNL